MAYGAFFPVAIHAPAKNRLEAVLLQFSKTFGRTMAHVGGRGKTGFRLAKRKLGRMSGDQMGVDSAIRRAEAGQNERACTGKLDAELQRAPSRLNEPTQGRQVKSIWCEQPTF